jgi:uncharacterized protein (TIGR02391 family)
MRRPPKHRIALFSAEQLTAIAKILADTATGPTGTQIGHLVESSGMEDVSPDATNWQRLFNAFVNSQITWQYGNHVVMFITRAMDPAEYNGNLGVFIDRRQKLNVVLSFAGMELGSDGKMRQVQPAKGLDEALTMASRLHAALVGRAAHAEVLTVCRPELLQDRYFHAVLEATKAITSRIRTMSGLMEAGADLVQQAFALNGGPVLAINALATDTDKGEQQGFANLLTGLFGTIKNPLARDPKDEWDMSEQDALDILTMASLIHRKLDGARRA